ASAGFPYASDAPASSALHKPSARRLFRMSVPLLDALARHRLRRGAAPLIRRLEPSRRHGTTRPCAAQSSGAGGGSRTHTALAGRGIWSPLRLPIPPLRRAPQHTSPWLRRASTCLRGDARHPRGTAESAAPDRRATLAGPVDPGSFRGPVGL